MYIYIYIYIHMCLERERDSYFGQNSGRDTAMAS